MKEENTTVFDDLAGGLLITDAHAKILYANESFVHSVGYSVGEVIGKKPSELWGGHMPHTFYEDLWRDIKTLKKPFVRTFRNTTKSHKILHQENHIAPILNEEGEVEFFIEMQARDGKREKQFTDEFVSLFSGETPSVEVFSAWYARWQGIHFDGFEVTSALHDMLHKQAIRPLQERFAARYDDHALITDAQGDSQKFSQLYEKYHDDVKRYFLSRVGGDETLAADLTQDTFLRAFSYFSHFQISNASYRTYLFRIAHSILVNYYRRQKTLSLESFDQIADTIVLPFEYSIFENLKKMRSLKDTEKHILIMKYYEGFSVREISGVVDKSENAVKLILSRARKKMKKELSS